MPQEDWSARWFLRAPPGLDLCAPRRLKFILTAVNRGVPRLPGWSPRAHALRRWRSGEKSRNLLNRALRALNKDRSTAHVAESLARLSSAESSDRGGPNGHRPLPVGARVKSLSIQ